MIDKINVRVYGIAIENAKILTLFESYAGLKMYKFPGGGLEFGEGLHECLHREFAEELNLKIEITGHLYTQEDLIISRFRENEQILIIYYAIKILDWENLKITDDSIDRVEWLTIDDAKKRLELPTDLRVLDLLNI